jgi:hypothetical protein
MGDELADQLALPAPTLYTRLCRRVLLTALSAHFIFFKYVGKERHAVRLGRAMNAEVNNLLKWGASESVKFGGIEEREQVGTPPPPPRRRPLFLPALLVVVGVATTTTLYLSAKLLRRVPPHS